MSETHRARYDALPYRHGSIAKSSPARTGVIARMLKIPAAAPDACRVLEIGCAEGMNLLPLAERFPNSRFTGIDFSPVQIANADRARAAAEIPNACFLEADIRIFEPEPESFDYIIAHGIYSWVEEDVREALLALCSRALAKNGVAYISYNAQPGWAFTTGLREVLLGLIGQKTDTREQSEEARKTLHVLDRLFAAEEGPYAALMREAIGEMLGKSPALTMHDELACVNAPVTYLDFCAHAKKHDLHFLAESHYASMPFEHMKPALREIAGEIAGDFDRRQQMLDLIGARRFRASLLTRHPQPESRLLDPSVVRDCAIGTYFRLESPQVNLQPGTPMQVVGNHQVRLALDHPFQKAFFATLIAVAPHRIPFTAAYAEAKKQLARFQIEADHSEEALCTLVQRYFELDQVDLQLAGSGRWLLDQSPPRTSPLMRWQAQNAYPIVNRWHETVEIQANEKRWLAGAPVRVDEKRMHSAGLLL